MLIVLTNAQLYSGYSYGYVEISPIDACTGDQCRKTVKAIMDRTELIQKQLIKLDDVERELVKENEHDMSDMSLFTGHDEQRNMRKKIRAQNEGLRKVRRTRNNLMRALRKVVGKLSIPQQGRLIRYLNLENYINVKYDDFSQGKGLPSSFSTCDNNKGVMPKLD